MADISLPKCNLYLVASGLDSNGNKVVKMKFPNSRTFAIQTNGNLNSTGRILRGLKTATDMKKVSSADLKVIATEVCDYIQNYGSATQKKSLKIYKSK